MKKTIILTIITLTMISYGYCWIAANYSCNAFIPNQCDNDGESKINTSTPMLGQLVIDAAGYFLQSNSDYQLFLKKVELSGYGLNYAELQEVLTASIYNMELAHSTYYQLWSTSLSLDYNPTILERLKQFDYASFQVINGLTPSVFSQVVDLLKVGNVKGSYKWIYLSTGKILEKLKSIEKYVKSNIFPDIPTCWRVNQQYLELELYGQYMAEVFYTVQ